MSAEELWKAARCGNDAEISRLAEQGVDINAVNWNGWTAVLLSAQNGHHGCLELLHRLGADVNKARNDGGVSMHAAAWKNHIKCIEVLQKRGADVNQANKKGQTPMYIAAYYGHHQCIEVLHKLGGDVNQADKNGTTPAQIAEKEGHTECVELIRRLAVLPVPSQPVATDLNPEDCGDRTLSVVCPVEAPRCSICSPVSPGWFGFRHQQTIPNLHITIDLYDGQPDQHQHRSRRTTP